MSNVTEETIRKFGQQALSVHAEIEDAKASVKNAKENMADVLTNAEKAGIDKSVLKQFIKDQSKDQGTLDLFYDDYSRFREVMRKPVLVRETA